MEAGLPAAGPDLNEDIVPPEANLEGKAFSLNKGCYPGQEVVARMDSDDIALPDRFEKQVAYMAEHPECVAVGSRVVLIDPYGAKVERPTHKTTHEEIESELLNGVGWAMVHPTVMMRREPLMRVGGYREDLMVSEVSPYPGTVVFDRLLAEGRIRMDDEYFRSLSFMTSLGTSNSHTHYSRTELQFYRLFAWSLFYSLSYAIRPARIARLARDLGGGYGSTRLSKGLINLSRRRRNLRAGGQIDAAVKAPASVG